MVLLQSPLLVVQSGIFMETLMLMTICSAMPCERSISTFFLMTANGQERNDGSASNLNCDLENVIK